MTLTRRGEAVEVEDRAVATVRQGIGHGASAIHQGQETLRAKATKVGGRGTAREARGLVDRIGRAGVERQALDEVADIRVALGFDLRDGEGRDRRRSLVVEPLDARARDFEFFQRLGFILLFGRCRRRRGLRGKEAGTQRGNQTQTRSRNSGRQ